MVFSDLDNAFELVSSVNSARRITWRVDNQHLCPGADRAFNRVWVQGKTTLTVQREPLEDSVLKVDLCGIAGPDRIRHEHLVTRIQQRQKGCEKPTSSARGDHHLIGGRRQLISVSDLLCDQLAQLRIAR